MAIMRSLIAIAFISCIALCHPVDSDMLCHGERLGPSERLRSDLGNVTLGFTSFGDPNLTYLATWFIEEDDTIIWLANRDEPLSTGSGNLTVDSSKRLLIGRQRGGPIEIYAGGSDGVNASAILLDDGNFVLREVSLNGSIGKVLWQSFDYPADVLVSGAKLGVNHRTGRNWTLTSWSSLYSPATGSLTLQWDPHGCRVEMRQRGKLIWASRMISIGNVTTMESLSGGFILFSFSSVSNAEEDYLTFVFSDMSRDTYYRGHPVFLKLGSSGWIKRSDGLTLSVLNTCYGYNTDSGCEIREIPTCRRKGDLFGVRRGWFEHPPGSNYSKNQYVKESVGYSDCRELCWNDCTCRGFRTDEDDETGCFIYNKTSLIHNFLVDFSGRTEKYYAVYGGKKDYNDTGHWSFVWILALTPAGLAFVSLAVCGVAVLFSRLQTGDKYASRLLKTELEREVSQDQNLRDFSYGSVVEATSNFSKEFKLGQGGFGPVYKGKLPEGQQIAVKRLSRSSSQGLTEFKNELILIAKLQHTNLVRLLGYCIRGDDVKILIYEYMPNKSLDFFLFDPARKEVLEWSLRVRIIEGISQGILYLHKYSRLRVIHRDLKAGNILLDDSMNPKISDFGMARIFKQDENQANTNRVVGTYGYMSPEYARNGIFSEKSDIFSFGVLLLEILSGRKSNSFNHEEDGPSSLVGHAWELWQRDASIELADHTLMWSSGGSFPERQFVRFAHVGLWCVEDSAQDRPTISEVVAMLANESVPLPELKRPAFSVGGGFVSEERCPVEPETFSGNSVTVSSMYGR